MVVLILCSFPYMGSLNHKHLRLSYVVEAKGIMYVLALKQIQSNLY